MDQVRSAYKQVGCPSSVSVRLSKETHSWPSVRTRTRTKETQRLPHSSSSLAQHIPSFRHTTPPLSHSTIVRAGICTTVMTTATIILTTTTGSAFTMKIISPTRNVSSSSGRRCILVPLQCLLYILFTRFLFEEVLHGRTGRGYTRTRMPAMSCHTDLD